MDVLVNIDVPNLDEAVRFYEDGVGLRLQRKLFDGTVAQMQGCSCLVYLLTRHEGSSPVPLPGHDRRYMRHWTPVHLDFVVDDLEAAVQKARTAGAVLETLTEQFSWGRLAMLSDPFGHGLCLLQWSRSGYDEVA
jgi:predicted enzyme related to lactoylglutathione lyase